MSPPPGRIVRWRRRLTRVLVAVASLLASLFLVEIVLRLCNYDPVLSQPDCLDNPWRTVDPALIMANPGLRGEELFRTRKGERVVVALGDSFTHGYPVASKDSYPTVLESILAEAGESVQVLNMGFGNTGTDQQLRLFEERVLRHVHPEVVVWQFYANDVSDNIRQPAYAVDDGVLVPLDGTRHWLARRQHFFDAFPCASFLRANSRLFRAALKAFERGELPVDAANLEWSKQKIELATERMKSLSQQYGFEVCWVLIAPQAAYSRSAAASAGHFAAVGHAMMREALKGVSGLHEICFGDSGSEVFAGPERDTNAEGDRHFNERGYRLLAERLAVDVRTLLRSK